MPLVKLTLCKVILSNDPLNSCSWKQTLSCFLQTISKSTVVSKKVLKKMIASHIKECPRNHRLSSSEPKGISRVTLNQQCRFAQ